MAYLHDWLYEWLPKQCVYFTGSWSLFTGFGRRDNVDRFYIKSWNRHRFYFLDHPLSLRPGTPTPIPCYNINYHCSVYYDAIRLAMYKCSMHGESKMKVLSKMKALVNTHALNWKHFCEFEYSRTSALATIREHVCMYRCFQVFNAHSRFPCTLSRPGLLTEPYQRRASGQ